jgi:hypothetical protein
LNEINNLIEKKYFKIDFNDIIKKTRSLFEKSDYATDEGYGILQTVKNTVDALEHKIKKVKRDK